MQKVLRRLIFALVMLFAIGYAQDMMGTTVAKGLNGPMGVLVAEDGSVWVIDSGMGGDQTIEGINPETGEKITATVGNSARIVKVAADGTQTDVATLPSLFTGQEATGGARLALLDGTLYATSGFWVETSGPTPLPLMSTVVKLENDTITQVADTWAFESSNNPDGFVKESHPYGLATGPDGNLWIADAGANTVYTVDPSSGDITLVATLGGIAGPLPNPGRGNAQESDPVPTGIVVDQDGSAYVSLLPGFPFLPGSAKIVKISADGTVSDYATGLTMVTDLQMAPDGNLYAVQLGVFTEQGPTPNSGVLIRIKDGQTEEVLSGLSFPTGISFNSAGDAYLTINGAGAPGTGEVQMFTGIAKP
jgi:DNA-binding beta-propeller fold protein YncE